MSPLRACTRVLFVALAVLAAREGAGQELLGLRAEAVGFRESYQIDIRQPIDHGDLKRGFFRQRFILSHRGEDRPTVLYGSGYGLLDNREVELAALLQANQVVFVHRFFPGAAPYPRDWRVLTVRQAAEDMHRIREALRPIYPGPWVNAGRSKGGMAALFFHRFHPEDVAATVAYVAPLPERPDDPRVVAFLNEVGTLECRRSLADFQRRVLIGRVRLLPWFHEYGLIHGLTYYGRVSEEAAFEYSVLEYPFAFWQYGNEADCAGVPGEGAEDYSVVAHLTAVSAPDYYDDRGVAYFEPLFYQAYTELGYCPYVTGPVSDLLRAVGEPTYRTFAPPGAPLVFRPEVMEDIVPWLRDEGARIVSIYGGNDPWTAYALTPRAGLDALAVVQPGANHRVLLGDLDRRAEVFAALERWTGVRIDAARVEAAAAGERAYLAKIRERF